MCRRRHGHSLAPWRLTLFPRISSRHGSARREYAPVIGWRAHALALAEAGKRCFDRLVDGVFGVPVEGKLGMDQPTDQSIFWDERADAWDRNAEAMEGFARQFGDLAMELLGPAPGHHLADVGCGPGLTTIELAHRVAPTGTVTGVDVSPRMIETASARSLAMDVGNVSFVVGDPSAGPVGSFDGIYSRFGVMFFDDPPAAFRNIAQSIRPGGRFVAVVWADLDANPWMFVPTLFGAGPLNAELNLPGPGEPGPFSLADPAETAALLESCGFHDVDVERHEHAWTFDAPTADASISEMLSVGALGEAWAAADAGARAAAVEAVLKGCDDHRDQDGWRLPATALTISASLPF